MMSKRTKQSPEIQISEYSLNPLNLNSALAKQLTIKETPSPPKTHNSK